MPHSESLLAEHTFSLEKTAQRAAEFGLLLALLKAEGVTRILEIGTRHGDALHEFGRLVGEGGTVVGVDLPGGAWGDSQSQGNAERAVADLVAQGVNARMVFGDSTSPAVVAEALAQGPFDFVFIDGDHSLAGVTADWKNYRDAGRIIGFHDIAAHLKPKKKADRYGVPTLWQKLKRDHTTVEIVEPAATMGIGVLWRA